MKSIFKYPINICQRQSVRMPLGAQIISAQIQCDDLMLRAFVSPDEKAVNRIVNIYGTGHAMPNNPGHFVGTVQQDGGSLVWHVFAENEVQS